MKTSALEHYTEALQYSHLVGSYVDSGLGWKDDSIRSASTSWMHSRQEVSCFWEWVSFVHMVVLQLLTTNKIIFLSIF